MRRFNKRTNNNYSSNPFSGNYQRRPRNHGRSGSGIKQAVFDPSLVIAQSQTVQ